MSYLIPNGTSIGMASAIWASAWDFQQCGILTCVDSDEPLQPPVKLRNSKWCSVSSLTVIEYSSDYQRLWSDCAYAQADLRLCWSHIPQCCKSHATAHIVFLFNSRKVLVEPLIVNDRMLISVLVKLNWPCREKIWLFPAKNNPRWTSAVPEEMCGKQIRRTDELVHIWGSCKISIAWRSCADPEGGGAGGPDPPEKLQKCRVS